MKRAVIALALFALGATGCALGTRPFVFTEHPKGFQSVTVSRCVLADGPVQVAFQDKHIAGKHTTQETWTFSVDHCTAARLKTMKLQVLANARKPRTEDSWIPLGDSVSEKGANPNKLLPVLITKDWREELGTPIVVRYRSKVDSADGPWAYAQIGTQTPWLSPLILTGVAALVITGLTVGGN
jgi:hypothetical protein